MEKKDGEQNLFNGCSVSLDTAFLTLKKEQILKPKVLFSFIRINRLYGHHDIYFKVKDGPIHLAIAPNGSGKTTVARFLLRFLDSACAGRYCGDASLIRLNFDPVLDMAKTFCCSNILIGFKLPNQKNLCFAIYPVGSKSRRVNTTYCNGVAMDARELDGELENLEIWQTSDSNEKGLTSNSLEALIKYDFPKAILLDANKLASQSDYIFYQQLFDLFNKRFSPGSPIVKKSLEACGLVNCARFQQEISFIFQQAKSPLSRIVDPMAISEKGFADAFVKIFFTWLTYVLRGYDSDNGAIDDKCVEIANDIRKNYTVYLKPVATSPNGLAHILCIPAATGLLLGIFGCRSILSTDKEEQSLIKFSNLFYDYITNDGFPSLIELYFDIKKTGRFSLLEIDLSNDVSNQTNEMSYLHQNNFKWKNLKFYSIFPKKGANQRIYLRPKGEVKPLESLGDGLLIDIAIKRVNDIIIIRDAFEKLSHLPLVSDGHEYEIQVGKTNYEGSFNGAYLPLQNLSSGEKALLEILCSFSLGKADRYDPARDYPFASFSVDNDPIDFIIIDEPENSLHISWQEQLIDVLNNLAKRNGKEALIFTHSPHIIANSLDSLCEVEMSNANGKLY